MATKEVVIVNGARTAIGRFGGALRNLTVVDIGVAAVKGALERSGLKPEQVDEVLMGHARQAGTGPNVARIVAVKGGLPVAVPAFGVQQACLSGIKAVMLAHQSIALGQSEVVLAGGMEHLSSVPYLAMDTRWGARLGDAQLIDAMYQDGYTCGITGRVMGELTDDLARAYGITREEQDRFALASQQKVDAATKSGFFTKVIVPMEVPVGRGTTVIFDKDEHPRPNSSLEGLAQLAPVFRADGTITAGSSSGITDGAAAMVVASREKADALALRSLGRIVSYAVAAVEPSRFGIGPVPAVKLALQKAGLTLDDMDLFEINEAFAAQVLAVMKELNLDGAKVNIHGGAIALGHPTGMSGARITLELLYALEEQGGRYGLAAICGNGGHGGAMILELAPERRR